MHRKKGSIRAKRERTDREKLELFTSKVDELRNTRLGKKGVINVRHIMDSEEGSKLEQPDEADLKDYLMTFRHFISDQEDVFLGRIFNICHRRLMNEEMKQDLAYMHQLFNRIKLHNGISLHVDGNELSPLQVTDIYLNGKYFHNDLEYQNQLDTLPSSVADMLRFHFLHFVINGSKVIFYVQNVVSLAFSEQLLQFDEVFQTSSE